MTALISVWNNNYKERVGIMYFSKIYITFQELSDLYKSKLSKEDKDRFKNYDFVPLNLKINENDMSIEALLVPTPKSNRLESPKNDFVRRYNVCASESYVPALIKDL